jgi:hypothetical protein
MAAEDPSPATTPGKQHAASYEASRQATGPLAKEARITPALLPPVLKWAGVALLVVATLMAVYLAAGLLGELAAWSAYP